MVFRLFFSSKPNSRKPNASKPARRSVRPHMETLEDRSTPTANSISGFVYTDSNNNGIFDAGETPLANVSLQLKSNTTNQIVATATSNANGFYEFLYDNTVQTTPQSVTKTVTFPPTDTNFSLTGQVDKFDPALGQLTSIDIIHSGSITSTILVENTSRSSGSTITGTVSGSLNLVAPGLNDTLTLSQNAGSITVGLYDNVPDFQGASGGTLGTKTATGSKTTTISGPDLAAWQGTGTVTIQEIGNATSSATGGGNVNTAVTSTGQSSITVRYNYVPTNTLQPGPYTILETQPVGYLDGKDAKAGVPIPNSVGTDVIVLDLSNSPLINNNFGELLASSVSGFVYHDVNNDGLKQANEAPITGVSMTLTGTDDLGQAVTQSTTTNASGQYQFLNLRPGTYTVSQTQPLAYLDGKETPGTVGQGVTGFIAGNTAVNDQIAAIGLPGGAHSFDNNFGELQGSSVSGYVYVDANNDGIKDAGEQPIPGVTVTLTGFTNDGPVQLTTTTDAAGFYSFAGLKPGTYAITETQPVDYADGKDTVGTLGGTVGADAFTSVLIGSGVAGINYNFGELPQDTADVGIVKTANKSQVTVGETLTYTLTVTNYGQYTAKGLTVSDTLPAGSTFISASGTGWTVSHSNGVVTATMPSLLVNASSTITVQIKVPAVSATITNVTTVTTTTTDNNPNNNTSTVSTPVVVPPPPVQPLAQLPLGGIDSSKNSFFADPDAQAVRQKLAKNAGAINALYQTLLSRVPDTQTYNSLRAQMYNGLTAASLTQTLIKSNEHRTLQAEKAYKAILGRSPTASERNAAIATLNASGGPTVLERQLLSSAEFATKHTSQLGLVTAIYFQQTGVLPSQVQSQTLVQSMNNSTLNAVIADIQNSDDARRDTIRAAFRDVLRRNAKTSEVDSWLSTMKAKNMTQDALYTALYGTSEFAQLSLASIKY